MGPIMNWQQALDAFMEYLQLERSMAKNTLEAYQRDVTKLIEYLGITQQSLQPHEIQDTHIEHFLAYLYDLNVAPHTQARVLSGIKAFYKFLSLQNQIEQDPTQLIEAPKLTRKLPDVLTVTETLYSSGLRVSELINLTTNNLFFDIGFLKVVGKGNKQRFVPIGSSAIKHLQLYLDHIRNQLNIQKGHEQFVFLNRRGKQLTRVMIFTIVKKLAELAGKSSYFSTFICDSFGRRRSRFARCTGNVRPRIYYHYRNLYTLRYELSQTSDD